MNEKDTKIVVDQLEEKLKNLHKCKESWMRQMAMIGNKLYECYVDIDSLEGVLDKLIKECDEDCGCDDDE
jgi:hypothetical protein